MKLFEPKTFKPSNSLNFRIRTQISFIKYKIWGFAVQAFPQRAKIYKTVDVINRSSGVFYMRLKKTKVSELA